MSMYQRGPKPFAVILCSFSDLPVPDIPLSFVRDFVAGGGSQGLFEFWQDTSFGNISLEGSQVYGWFPMQYAWQGDSAKNNRDTWIAEARRLAAANSIDLAPYRGIIAVVNGAADDSASSSTPTDLAIALPTTGLQYQWFYCKKCQGMGYDSGAGPGPCAAGGVHYHDGSNAYALAIDAPFFDGQTGWKYCIKCRDLAYNGAGISGPCAAGGLHDHSTSGDYSLAFDSVGFRGQDGWKWCRKCQALAYSYSQGGPGPCLAGGVHDHSTSFDYVIPYGGNGFSVEFVGHESGHTFGLHHSWSANPDTEYGDPWDIMSAFLTDSGSSGPYSPVGPRLNAATMNRYEWLDESRVIDHVPGRGVLFRGTKTFEIAALHRPDIDLPLMVKVHTPDRIFTVEFRQKQGWDIGISRDTVLIHELRSYYCSSQKNWRYCGKCQGLHYAGYHVCAAGGLHDLIGSADYHLSIDDPSAEGQDNWRWCRRCNQMAYAGGNGPGPCAAGGLHDQATSGDYRLATAGPGQDQWRYCRKCKCLNYAEGNRLSACMAGGSHDDGNSLNYVLRTDNGAGGQDAWCWCKKCQGLVYSLRSACPAGGRHTWEGSSDYGLAWHLASFGQRGWFWCNKCSGLAFGTDSTSGVCPGGGAHDRAFSFDYRLPTAPSRHEGQPQWARCGRCQGLFYGPTVAASQCPAGGAHQAADEPSYILANWENDNSYLLGGDRQPGDVFVDDAGYITITVKSIDSWAGTASITLSGYDIIVPGPVLG